MDVLSIKEIEDLAKDTVLKAMKEDPGNDFFLHQPKDSIFYRVYNDVVGNNGNKRGDLFASILEEKYKITFSK